MKSMWIRFVCLLLVSAVLLSGCATAQTPVPPPEEPAEAAPQETAPPEEPPAEPAAPTEEAEPAEEAAPAAEAGQDPVRIAALIPGRIDDMSFNQLFYEGLMRLQEQLGDRVEVTYTEGVYQVVDIEPALRDYANQGYDLIIGHGFQFQDPVMAVAPNYPDIMFALGPGTFMNAPNVTRYDLDNAQAGYVLGTVAGLATQSNKVSSIGGMDVPNVHMIHEGYRMAAETINPDVEVVNLYIGDFRDAEASREATLSMIDQGVDVIFVSGDGITVGGLEASKQKGVPFITSSDMSALAPEVFLASLSQSFEVALTAMVEDIEASGALQQEFYGLTLQNGGMELVVHLADKTAGFQDQIDAVIQGLIDGTVVIPEITFE